MALREKVVQLAILQEIYIEITNVYIKQMQILKLQMPILKLQMSIVKYKCKTCIESICKRHAEG